MKTSQFRTPLIQSAIVLGAVIVLFTIVSSSGAGGAGGGFFAIFSGIGYLILFGIGMAISLVVSIAILIAIFLGAVAMVDSEQARNMYSDLKKNSALNVLAPRGQCCDDNPSGTGISEEEYDRMKQEIIQLRDNSDSLQDKLKELTGDKDHLQGNLDSLNGENTVLKGKIEELSLAVENLQNSEKEIKSVVDGLTEKVQAGADQDIKDTFIKLGKLQAGTRKEIEDLIERLNYLEIGLKQSPTFGIFSYIEKNDQAVFIKTVEDAVAQDMTYSQIHEYLTKNLSAELDKIIKDHPSLAKTYIRNLRKD
jgi:uncharacterized membrane protein